MYYNNSRMYNKYPYFPWPNEQMFYMYQNKLFHGRMPDEVNNLNKTNNSNDSLNLNDYGPEPLSVNLKNASKKNNTFRTVLWTGNNLQVVFMSIAVSFSVDPYFSDKSDQIISVASGTGIIKIGNSEDVFDYQTFLTENLSILIPLGKWTTILNLGNVPLKLYITYAPPEFKNGTIHETKEDAKKAELSSKLRF